MTYQEALEEVKHANCDTIYLIDLRETLINALEEAIKHQETFEWCTDCKEYDQEQYCCHRWGKRIKETISESREYWYNKGFEDAEARMSFKTVEYSDYDDPWDL